MRAPELYTAEFYGTADPEELLAAVDVPAARSNECADAIGRLLCRIRRRDSVNALLIDERGNAVERLIVFRK